MFPIRFHLGLRQVVMALMHWAIDVPQELLQSDAKLFLSDLIFFLDLFNIHIEYY